ncbi:GatB/YqeY domain-containing protein [Rhodococcus sp. D2-41]|uniref:GatB/YqeY domain-containing protein n=1 Tax=Speluncibacter jeojiensis TaxID=2710754 RepID=A0A9X4M525_9ACTN|nr:GatB/YqeY domain-containing protein [Rhodococcus sp. D2-41]MDG3009406.1 GatB/YqeY domain-containing protein [Rhodococcus sp. D2-41]MDG3016967.1 GatB/YqeY domain-containing protein [Corynebacteriales bacterium D3-21]
MSDHPDSDHDDQARQGSNLKTRIRADLTGAMKAKDATRTGTLRMVLAAIQTEEVAGKQARELGDDDVLKVLTKEAKKRAEAAAVFAENGRDELAAKERAEGEIIAGYLPAQLDDDELGRLVDKAVAEVAEHLGEQPGMRQMGQIMKAASALVSGRADGSRVSAAVKARLG